MREIKRNAASLKSLVMATTAFVVVSALASVAAQAAPIAVTFAPSAVVSGTGNFTADKLNLLDFSRVDLGATSGSNTAFTESGYLQFNNASLNNSTFDPAGQPQRLLDLPRVLGNRNAVGAEFQRQFDRHAEHAQLHAV